MKNWLKQQITEFTAWVGLIIIICAVFAPTWVSIGLGVVLLVIDDVKASNTVKNLVPWVTSKIIRI